MLQTQIFIYLHQPPLIFHCSLCMAPQWTLVQVFIIQFHIWLKRRFLKKPQRWQSQHMYIMIMLEDTGTDHMEYIFKNFFAYYCTFLPLILGFLMIRFIFMKLMLHPYKMAMYPKSCLMYRKRKYIPNQMAGPVAVIIILKFLKMYTL